MISYLIDTEVIFNNSFQQQDWLYCQSGMKSYRIHSSAWYRIYSVWHYVRIDFISESSSSSCRWKSNTQRQHIGFIWIRYRVNAVLVGFVKSLLFTHINTKQLIFKLSVALREPPQWELFLSETMLKYLKRQSWTTEYCCNIYIFCGNSYI